MTTAAAPTAIRILARAPARTPAQILQARIDRQGFERLMMLTDGVFAIVITLTALELRPPAVTPSGLAALWSLLRPGLLPYALTFLVISGYWSGHRRMVSRLHRLDGVTIALNLLFLGLVALQPAGLQLLMRPGSIATAAAAYVGLVCLTGVVQASAWIHACFVAKLVDASLSRRVQLGRLASILLLPLAASMIGLSTMREGGPLPALAVMVGVGLVILSRRLTDRS